MSDQGDGQGVGWKVQGRHHLVSQGRCHGFGEIGRVVPEATPRILSKQLREMELDGLVRKVVYPEVPPRTEYSLTEDGFAIIPVIMAMYEWEMSRRESYGGR